MNTQINATPGTIGNTPIVQLGNFNTDSIQRVFDTKVDAKKTVDKAIVEHSEANYCSLPEYCLIEDKWKYLAGLL